MESADKIQLFDGAFGTELEKFGLNSNDAIDLNITKPDIVQKIHKSYSKADFVTTNTFGLNSIKYKGKYKISELCNAAIDNANATHKKIAFDIGPTGSLLKPIGTLSFDEAYKAYKEIAQEVWDKIDVFLLETFTDIYEIKAAILAIKDICDKPIFATMSFDKNKKTLTGSSVEIVMNTLTALGANAIGINCGNSIKDFDECIKEICRISTLPVIAQPNRGIPKYSDGKAVYDMDINTYESYIKKFINYGATYIGGCCGTDPEIISAISKFKDKPVKKINNKMKSFINSATKITEIKKITVCGERINPTGNKTIKQGLISNNFEQIIKEAILQTDAGADILDVNVGLAEINESEVLSNLIQNIQEVVDTPLQIDTSDICALENALKYYNGVPIINSVSGKQKSMDSIFPLAKKYGAYIIALLLDDEGIPKTSEKRLQIAKKITKEAKKYQIRTDKLIFDCLILTASTSQNVVKECLKTVKELSSKGLNTTLGISNVSYGLPNRELLNKNFLSMALGCGLTMPITNPLDKEIKETITSSKALFGYDKECKKYIKSQSAKPNQGKLNENLTKYSSSIKDTILTGNYQIIAEITKNKLQSTDKYDLIENEIIPALDSVGKYYDEGKIYLPQLISCANTAKAAFQTISEKFSKSNAYKSKVILCTVKGDVHDIGKNICKVILESHGFEVIDLGKDTPIENIIQAYNKHKPSAIGLSALMTSTVTSMQQTIQEIKRNKCNAKLFVGGAVLSPEISNQIGADYYTKDAVEFVNVLEKVSVN